MIVIHRIVVAYLILWAFSAQAEGQEKQTSYHAGLIYFSQGDGLVANIPAQDALEVLQDVQTYRSALEGRQTRCAEDVEKTRFKTQDTLITIILPGGLLYAASKQHRHAEAKKEFVKISQQLHDLKDDLARLKATSSEETLAFLR